MKILKFVLIIIIIHSNIILWLNKHLPNKIRIVRKKIKNDIKIKKRLNNKKDKSMNLNSKKFLSKPKSYSTKSIKSIRWKLKRIFF